MWIGTLQSGDKRVAKNVYHARGEALRHLKDVHDKGADAQDVHGANSVVGVPNFSSIYPLNREERFVFVKL